jgi:hypothetical protein
MSRTLTHRLTVESVHPGRIICSGTFTTADGKGTHQLLRPVLHLDTVEQELLAQIMPGDVILRYDDGSHVHEPQPS